MAQTITFTGPQGGPGGGELSPGEGSTGFSSRIVPWANSSGQLTANSSGPVWDSTGNHLGIGTTSPSSPLTVQSSGGISQRWLSSAGADQMVFNSSGHLGIGTTSPVFGVHAVDGARIEGGVGGASTAELEIRGTDTAGGLVAVVELQGLTGIAAARTVAAMSGFYDSTADRGSLSLQSKSSASSGLIDRVWVNSSGEVGVGTTAPGAVLDVAGIPRLANSFTTAVGSTGAGGAPPASPRTYMAVLDTAGNSARIPLYNT